MADVSKIFKPRRGKKSTMAGTKATTVLSAGEMFIEVPDTGAGTGRAKMKMGDGSTQYSSLPYAMGDTENDEIAFSSNTSTTVATALNSVTSGGKLKNLIAGLKQAVSLCNTSITQLNDDIGGIDLSSINTRITNIETSFRDGCSTIASKITSCGVSTASNASPTTMSNNIQTIYNNRYNAGYNAAKEAFDTIIPFDNFRKSGNTLMNKYRNRSDNGGTINSPGRAIQDIKFSEYDLYIDYLHYGHDNTSSSDKLRLSTRKGSTTIATANLASINTNSYTAYVNTVYKISNDIGIIKYRIDADSSDNAAGTTIRIFKIDTAGSIVLGTSVNVMGADSNTVSRYNAIQTMPMNKTQLCSFCITDTYTSGGDWRYSSLTYELYTIYISTDTPNISRVRTTTTDESGNTVGANCRILNNSTYDFNSSVITNTDGCIAQPIWAERNANLQIYSYTPYYQVNTTGHRIRRISQSYTLAQLKAQGYFIGGYIIGRLYGESDIFYATYSSTVQSINSSEVLKVRYNNTVGLYEIIN